MPDIGYASMPVIPTFKGLQGQLERGSSKGLAAAGASGGTKFGDAAGMSAGRRFGDKFKTAAKAGVIAGLAGLAAGGKLLADSISSASHLNETVSKTAQIFGKEATPGLEKFAEKAAVALGQSKQEALDAASTFGVFGKSAGLQRGKLVKFSTGLDALASDLASFSDTSPEEAIQAIGSALRGEAEPIRAYGVLLDDATLKAEAMRLGILKPVKDKNKILSAQARVTDSQAKYNEAVKKNGKDSLEAIKAQGSLGAAQSALQKATDGTIPALTQQQKVLAAQASIYRQTTDQQGDFARTSGGLANQQRQLASRFANAKAELGKGLLPVATEFVTFLNDKGVPALDKFSTWFTEKGVPAIGKFTRKATPFVKGVLTDTRDILKDIEPYAKGVASAFNSLPGGVKKGLGAAALLGFAGSKLPGAKVGVGAGAGAAKGILGLVTKTKPLPVFVVNNLPGGKVGKFGKAAGVAGVAGEAGVIAAETLTVGSVVAAGALSVGAGLAFNKAGARYDTSQTVRTGHVGVTKPALVDPIMSAIDKKFNPEPLKRAAFYSGLARQNLAKLPADFNKGMNGAEALKSQVFGIESSTKRSRAAVVSLVDALEAARQRAVKVEQAVSVARQSKVDRQLGGGMYVANMNVHGTSLPEVRRDADHQRRARAHGAESFR